VWRLCGDVVAEAQEPARGARVKNAVLYCISSLSCMLVDQESKMATGTHDLQDSVSVGSVRVLCTCLAEVS